MVVFPPGRTNILIMCPTVPILYKSSTLGSSFELLACTKTPRVRSPLYAFLTSRTDFCRLTVIGITIPGNNTMLRIGKIGNSSDKTPILSSLPIPSPFIGINSIFSKSEISETLKCLKTSFGLFIRSI